VVLGRGGVGRVNPHRRHGQGCLHVPLGGVGDQGRIDRLGFVEVLAVGAQPHLMRLGLVFDRDQPGRFAGDLRAVRDHLAAVPDLAGLQHPQLAVTIGGEPGRVLVGEHEQDTIERMCCCDVDGGHPAPGHGGLEKMGVGGPVEPVLECVRGGMAGVWERAAGAATSVLTVAVLARLAVISRRAARARRPGPPAGEAA
jgi:hypothetical protein